MKVKKMWSCSHDDGDESIYVILNDRMSSHVCIVQAYNGFNYCQRKPFVR